MRMFGVKQEKPCWALGAEIMEGLAKGTKRSGFCSLGNCNPLKILKKWNKIVSLIIQKDHSVSYGEEKWRKQGKIMEIMTIVEI